tara:strand:- start:341 stop:1033 length:693 start_codon:yes stop_codon:yes gene_type:complete
MNEELELFRFKYDKNPKSKDSLIFMNPGFETVGDSIKEIIELTKEVLKVKINIRAFVLPDNTLVGKFNALASRNNDILFIGITKSLIEILNEKELRFVIGHEIGHGIFNHIQIKDEFEGIFSQCKEISADRVGFASVGDIAIAASTIHKMKYGLKYKNIEINIRNLMHLKKNPLEGVPTTHPIDSLRLESIIKFSMSKIYKEYIGEISYVFDNDKLDNLIYSKIKNQSLV